MLSDFDSHFSTLYLQTLTSRRPSCLSSPPWNPTITFRCVKARVYQISSTCFEFVLNRVISAIEKTTHFYNIIFLLSFTTGIFLGYVMTIVKCVWIKSQSPAFAIVLPFYLCIVSFVICMRPARRHAKCVKTKLPSFDMIYSPTNFHVRNAILY